MATAAAALCLPLALTTASTAQAATGPSARQLSQLETVAPSPSLSALGARVVGRLPGSTQMTAELALRPRSQAAITSFIDEVATPGSPMFHHYLTPGDYGGRFGPTTAALKAVEAQLRSDGLSVLSVSANRLLVKFSGSATRMEAAFHTGLDRVRLPGGEIGRATSSSVRLPESISRYTQAVIGLDNLVSLTNGLARDDRPAKAVSSATEARIAKHTHGVTSAPTACSAALQTQALYGAITDQQLADAYGVNGLYSDGDYGAGQTVDIFELEPFSISDVATFDKCYFGQSHTSNIKVTAIDGGPGSGLGSGEAALDVDDVSAIAPKAHIHVFEAPNIGPDTDDPYSSLDVYNAIAMADDASAISTSWGLCETELQQGQPGYQQAENNVFEQTAAQGQSVFAAAGDDGSDDCAGHDNSPVASDLSLDDPASQPYVASVGGTTFLKATEPPVESVWNNGTDGGAGGGGISETWAMPLWQAGFRTQPSSQQACSDDPKGTLDDLYHLPGVATTLPAGTLCRQTPDVSGLADPQSGITIVYDGQFFPIGGTSSSTPLWAAMTADMSASRACAANDLGFVNPLLYQVGKSSGYSTAFNDITAGNND
ncbi:MAG TPA: S53 family peptidase, partial [Acidimicrobiales bacterium]|nr:S53 family peptidase [Acidimicrobiales bacterium]